jgi:(p)ppGpp synthase/HD superfamily hydrolase
MSAPSRGHAILTLPKDHYNHDMLYSAYALAQEAHRTQTRHERAFGREHAIPYVIHPMRVSCRAADALRSAMHMHAWLRDVESSDHIDLVETIQTAGMLHDVKEDADLSSMTVRGISIHAWLEEFPPLVQWLVHAVTKPKEAEGPHPKGVCGKVISINHLLSTTLDDAMPGSRAARTLAWLLKASDRIDNCLCDANIKYDAHGNMCVSYDATNSDSSIYALRSQTRRSTERLVDIADACQASIFETSLRTLQAILNASSRSVSS